jgi:hypothetical protein
MHKFEFFLHLCRLCLPRSATQRVFCSLLCSSLCTAKRIAPHRLGFLLRKGLCPLTPAQRSAPPRLGFASAARSSPLCGGPPRLCPLTPPHHCADCFSPPRLCPLTLSAPLCSALLRKRSRVLVDFKAVCFEGGYVPPPKRGEAVCFASALRCVAELCGVQCREAERSSPLCGTLAISCKAKEKFGYL